MAAQQVNVQRARRACPVFATQVYSACDAPGGADRNLDQISAGGVHVYIRSPSKSRELYIQYDLNMAVTIRELGYPSRGMLYNWYKEFKENGGLREDHQLKHLKYSLEQRKQAIEYFIKHGRSISRTIKALGFPKRTVLRGWIKEDLSDEALPCATGKTLVRYTQEQKEQAVIQLCSKERTAREISADIGVSETSLRAWKRRLLNERFSDPMPNKRTSASDCKAAASPSRGDLANEKQVLL